MSMNWIEWYEYVNNRRDWLREVERERLAKLALGNPPNFLPGDIDFAVAAIRRVAGWLAALLSDEPRPPDNFDWRYRRHGI